MFFVADIFGTFLASIIFVPLLLVPGYVTGFLGDLFGFRNFSLNWRLAASIALSTALTPVLVYLLLLSHSGWLQFAIFGVFQALAVLLALGAFGHPGPAQWSRELKNVSPIAAAVACGWALLVACSLADLQIGHKAFNSVVIFDHWLRVAVTDAITRTGIPTSTPFNYLGGPAPLRYHIYWFALCSVAQRLSGGVIDARSALNGSVIWCGCALMCLICLYMRIFEGLEGAALKRRSLIGIGLLLVTGLDLLPNLTYYMRGHLPPQDMEWWTPDQVSSWVDALLWVPHHVGALVAGLTAFLLAWDAANCSGRRRRVAQTVVAGAGFASAAGCSIYVGFALLLVLSVWILFATARRWVRFVIPLVAAGIFGAILSAPYVLSLPGSGPKADFVDFGMWRSSATITHALQRHFLPFVAGLLQIPVTGALYAVEFGFFSLVAVMRIRTMRTAGRVPPSEAASMVIFGATLFFCTFIRSTTISSNDFGWRGMMLVQFILILWAARLIDSPEWSGMRLARMILAVGVAGTIYQVSVLRLYPVAYSRQNGIRTWSLRTLYGQLDRKLSTTAIVQSNPEYGADMPLGFYSHRQTAASGEGCAVTMGGSEELCTIAVPVIEQIFKTEAVDPAEVASIAGKFKLDAVIVTDADPVWDNPAGWIYRQKPAIETLAARAYFFPR